MSLYNRGGRMNDPQQQQQAQGASNVMEFPSGGKNPQAEKKGVRINGFKQVLDMLVVADPAFRESLLQRLQSRDPRLVQNLRRQLAQMGL